MAKFQVDGRVFDTERAAATWEAAAWLLLNDHELPDDLRELEGEVVE